MQLAMSLYKLKPTASSPVTTLKFLHADNDNSTAAANNDNTDTVVITIPEPFFFQKIYQLFTII